MAEGDLKNFFKEEERPLGFQSDDHFFQSLYRLASAIEAVHNYFLEEFDLHQIGCHYDLKPGNVLYRNGTLILSDFGLSRMVREVDSSKSFYRNGGGEYMAPESVSIENDFKSLRVGRSSDMWSFGCLLSEILTYMKKGPGGIRRFSKKREIEFNGYWTCKAFHAGDKPHPGVQEHLSDLDKDLDAPAQIEIMAIVRQLLDIEPSKRPKARSVTMGLFHAAQHDFYCTIKSKFHPLITSHLELRIEYERLLVWSEYSHVAMHACRDDQLADHNCWKTFGDLQLVQEGLYRVECEVESLASILSIKTPKSMRLASHIQRAVDSLWNMQPSEMQRQMTRTLENRLLSTDDSTELASMNSLEEALNDAFHGENKGSSASPQPTYRRIGLFATMKQITSELENQNLTQGSMQIDQHDIIRPLKQFHWHFIALYRGPRSSQDQQVSQNPSSQDSKSSQNQQAPQGPSSQDPTPSQVLIECLKYDSAWFGRTQELIKRVQDISQSRAISFATRAFPILKCVAFYHDTAKHSFGMVYEFPPLSLPQATTPTAPTPEKVLSLRNILHTVRSRADRPSLDTVFALALNLTTTVLAMHRANWLHKSISSYNIIFFPSRSPTIGAAMSSPYFIGFNYSRLNLETAFTQGPSQQLEYQHPEYLKNRKKFCQEFEYYSVGLVLLELGLWLPLENITESIDGPPEGVAEEVLKRYGPVLRTYMGGEYAEAVRVCLSGEFGGSEKPAEVREVFDRCVLQRIAAGVPKDRGIGI